MNADYDKTENPADPENLPDGSGTDAEPSQQSHHDAETDEDTASGGPADG